MMHLFMDMRILPIPAAEIAQLVARSSRNPKVVNSILTVRMLYAMYDSVGSRSTLYVTRMFTCDQCSYSPLLLVIIIGHSFSEFAISCLISLTRHSLA